MADTCNMIRQAIFTVSIVAFGSINNRTEATAHIVQKAIINDLYS